MHRTRRRVAIDAAQDLHRSASRRQAVHIEWNGVQGRLAREEQMPGPDVASGARAFEDDLALAGRQVDGLDRRAIVVVRAGKRADREENLSTWQSRRPAMRALAFLVVERRDSVRRASGRAHLKEWTSRPPANRRVCRRASMRCRGCRRRCRSRSPSTQRRRASSF